MNTSADFVHLTSSLLGVLDACGNKWWIATHVEDVSEAELTERMAKKVASTQN